MSPPASSVADIARAHVVFGDQQQRFLAALHRALDHSENPLQRLLCSTSFGMHDMAPSANPRLLFSCPEMTWTGICAVEESCFRRSSSVQPLISGKRRSKVMAAGWNSRAREIAVVPRSATIALASAAMAHIDHNSRECGVVLHDQQHAVAGRDQVAVVVHRHFLHQLGWNRSRRRRRIRSTSPLERISPSLEGQRTVSPAFRLRRGRDISLRQIEA